MLSALCASELSVIFEKSNPMSIRLIVAFMLLAGTAVYAQANKGKCGIEVHDVSSLSAFGYLTGYTVMLKNTTQKSADGIYFTAYFYNNEGRLIQKTEESFNSDSLSDPVAPGVVKSLVRSPVVKGASKVYVIVDRAHFTDGESCK